MPSLSQLSMALALAIEPWTVLSATSQDAWSLLYQPCPATCTEGTEVGGWATYQDVDAVKSCSEPMLLDFALYNSFDEPTPSVSVHACLPAAADKAATVFHDAASPKFSNGEVSLEIGWWGAPDAPVPQGVKDSLSQIQAALLQSPNNASKTIFAYSDNSLVGLYVGREIQHSDVASTTLQRFTERVKSQPLASRTVMQYCGMNANQGLGIVVDITGDFSVVQKTMRGWNEASCVMDFDGKEELLKSPLRMQPLPPQSTPNTTTTITTTTTTSRKDVDRRAATCRTVQVASGDSCASLAQVCGISGADFTKYNPDSTLCSSLKPGQRVCCSAGELPDFSPKPGADGTCATYTVQSGDWCAKIAASNDISVDDIEKWNKNTWGWAGCAKLQAQQNICLSSGEPPMPAPVQNAVCGPQVVGTEKPTDGSTELADLNPCPLNTCCNIWGQCGITSDFCIPSTSSTGAPGTAAEGSNGCISNCGVEIVNDEEAPAEFISIGYFEAWNQDRGCLDMDISSFNTDAYTHVHFAFATITEDFKVDVSKVQGQFDKLKSVDTRRIPSFGGWSFSTDQDSYPIFREGVSPENRETFATNAAQFIQDHDLDGIDFDWEYPGAPDVPGIPAGDPGDGDRYLEFLKAVRDKLPSYKTVSVAAPASFWYLKGFPIKEISEVVDYIVYMTYDLHGQWDYGNAYAVPGCSSGNCLRSHVNLTETESALAMITKAGVSSTKVIVGVSSYGRSFEMVDAGCTGPMCKYTGPDSGATPGKCTNTAGYLANAEIDQIIDSNDSAQKSFDDASDSNILVYNATQWVAYMDDTTKQSRTALYKSLNMGGTVDWAVDLQSFSSDDGNDNGNGGSLDQQVFYVDPSVWEEDSPAMNCEAPCVLVLPDWPLPSSTVITRPPHITTLDVAWSTTTDVTDSNDNVSPSATVTRILQETTIPAPPVTITSLPLANINVTVPLGDEELTFSPKPRLPAQTFIITDDPNPLKEEGVTHPPVTRTVNLPPWPEASVVYLPGDLDEDDDVPDDGQDDGEDDEDDDDRSLLTLPRVTLTHGPGGPGPCISGCGELCSSLIDRFCPSGGGDGGSHDPDFPSPIDPNPPDNPNDPDDNHSSSSSSCSESSVTNYWVSCATRDPAAPASTTSTSCTTTSSMVAVGCHVTATTSTTGVPVCYAVDPNADQGQDGTIPASVSATATTTRTDSSEPTSTVSNGHTATTTTFTDTDHVVISYYKRNSADKEFWAVGVAREDETFDICNDFTAGIDGDDDIDYKDPPFPGKLASIHIFPEDECTYDGTSKKPGKFDCTHFDEPVQCENFGYTGPALNCDNLYWMYPKVYCPWPYSEEKTPIEVEYGTEGEIWKFRDGHTETYPYEEYPGSRP